MMTLHTALSLLAQGNLNAQLNTQPSVLPTEPAEVRFSGVCTDSRKVQPGDLFVALAGEKFDGHAFLDQVKEQGAVAALVSRPVVSSLPQLLVNDTKIGLGALARGWRQQFDLPVIAVTGSNGKTTTKEMIAAILAAAFGAKDRLATFGNLNNDIGLPLTLLRLRSHHRAAVVELGMNHPGETEWLASIAQPTVALVNNAQREHQEFMQSVAAVAREHSLALLALPDDGVAVFPADEEYTPVWKEAAAARRVIDFAVRQDSHTDGAAVTALPYLAADHSDVHLATPLGETTIKLQAAGLHNVRNAAAATAATLAIGVPLAMIHQGLEAFTPVQGRLQHSVLASGLHLIDDTYNANPDSARAAIDVLAACPAPQLLILGDMGEVGDAGPAFHAEIGAYAQQRGISGLLATGALMRHAVAAFNNAHGEHEKTAPVAQHYNDMDALLLALRTEAQPGTVLIKGSRFMHMERVVNTLLAAQTAAAPAAQAAQPAAAPNLETD
jgi:UDP-N-acetylmuramoyl-tripeptide--D-alanyl-D-alanine ligase